jgi:putative oxidoreductase
MPVRASGLAFHRVSRTAGTTEMYEHSIADSFGKLILRLALGGMVLLHGLAKVLNPDALGFISGQLQAADLPTWLAYGVYLGEVLGPLLVIFGLFTRFGALMIVVNMLVAIALVHGAQLTQLNPQGGWQLELQGMFLFGALAVLFMGGGRLAVTND